MTDCYSPANQVANGPTWLQRILPRHHSHRVPGHRHVTGSGRNHSTTYGARHSAPSSNCDHVEPALRAMRRASAINNAATAGIIAGGLALASPYSFSPSSPTPPSPPGPPGGLMMQGWMPMAPTPPGPIYPPGYDFPPAPQVPLYPAPHSSVGEPERLSVFLGLIAIALMALRMFAARNRRR